MVSMVQLELQLPLQLMHLGSNLKSGNSLKMQAAVNDEAPNCSLQLTRMSDDMNFLITGCMMNLLEQRTGKYHCIVTSISNPETVIQGKVDTLTLGVDSSLVKQEMDPVTNISSSAQLRNSQEFTSTTDSGIVEYSLGEEEGYHQRMSCKKVYKRIALLRNHEAKLHTDKTKPKPDHSLKSPKCRKKKFMDAKGCSECGSKFTSEKSLLTHMEKVHNVTKSSHLTVGVTKLVEDISNAVFSENKECVHIPQSDANKELCKTYSTNSPNASQNENHQVLENWVIEDMKNNMQATVGNESISKECQSVINSSADHIPYTEDSVKNRDLANNDSDHDDEYDAITDISSNVDELESIECEEWNTAIAHDRSKKRKRSQTLLSKGKTLQKCIDKVSHSEAETVDEGKKKKYTFESNDNVNSKEASSTEDQKQNRVYKYPPFRCTRCNMHSLNLKHVRTHMLNKHTDIMSSRDIECDIEDMNRYMKHGKFVYTCVYCGRKRPGRAIFEHMQVWHKDETDYKAKVIEVTKKKKVPTATLR